MVANIAQNDKILIEKAGEFNRVFRKDASSWIVDGWTIIPENLEQKERSEIVGIGIPDTPPQDRNLIAEYFDEDTQLEYFWLPSQQAWVQLETGTTVSQVEAIAGVAQAPTTTFYMSPIVGDDDNDGLSPSTGVQSLYRMSEVLDSYIFIDQEVTIIVTESTFGMPGVFYGDRIRGISKIIFDVSAAQIASELRFYNVKSTLSIVTVLYFNAGSLKFFNCKNIEFNGGTFSNSNSAFMVDVDACESFVMPASVFLANFTVAPDAVFRFKDTKSVSLDIAISPGYTVTTAMVEVLGAVGQIDLAGSGSLTGRLFQSERNASVVVNGLDNFNETVASILPDLIEQVKRFERTVVISDQGVVSDSGSLPDEYNLSIQDTFEFGTTYIELLTNRSGSTFGGADRGGFVGMEDNGNSLQEQDFAFYNYQGGRTVFYNDTIPSSSVETLVINNDGAIAFPTYGLGTLRSDASGNIISTNPEQSVQEPASNPDIDVLGAGPTTFEVVDGMTQVSGNTVTKDFRVTLNFDAEVSNNGRTIDFAVFVNAVQVTDFSWSPRFDQAGDVSSITRVRTLLAVPAGATVDLRRRNAAASASTTLTIGMRYFELIELFS